MWCESYGDIQMSPLMNKQENILIQGEEYMEKVFVCQERNGKCEWERSGD